MQNDPLCRFHWRGVRMHLCSVMVFKWVCVCVAEIQVHALSLRHTVCFGWRNGCGWTACECGLICVCLQMLAIAQYAVLVILIGTCRSYRVSGCDDDLFFSMPAWLGSSYRRNKPSFHIPSLNAHMHTDLWHSWFWLVGCVCIMIVNLYIRWLLIFQCVLVSCHICSSSFSSYIIKMSARINTSCPFMWSNWCLTVHYALGIFP